MRGNKKLSIISLLIVVAYLGYLLFFIHSTLGLEVIVNYKKWSYDTPFLLVLLHLIFVIISLIQIITGIIYSSARATAFSSRSLLVAGIAYLPSLIYLLVPIIFQWASGYSLKKNILRVGGLVVRRIIYSMIIMFVFFGGSSVLNSQFLTSFALNDLTIDMLLSGFHFDAKADYSSVIKEYSKEITQISSLNLESYQNKLASDQITFEEKVDLRVENTSKLAELTAEGTTKLAKIYYYSANGIFSDYYDSVGKLNEVYFDEIKKMTELELNN